MMYSGSLFPDCSNPSHSLRVTPPQVKPFQIDWTTTRKRLQKLETTGWLSMISEIVVEWKMSLLCSGMDFAC